MLNTSNLGVHSKSACSPTTLAEQDSARYAQRSPVGIKSRRNAIHSVVCKERDGQGRGPFEVDDTHLVIVVISMGVVDGGNRCTGACELVRRVQDGWLVLLERGWVFTVTRREGLVAATPECTRASSLELE